MTTALLIIHGLVAVALLGAISHQTLATCSRDHATLARMPGETTRIQPPDNQSKALSPAALG
jgi:hypothetical protein